MGAGAGCFDDAYRLQGLPLSEGSRFAHNIPLQTLVELGLVGGLLGLAVVWEVGRRWKGGLLSTGAGCGVLAVFFFFVGGSAVGDARNYRRDSLDGGFGPVGTLSLGMEAAGHPAPLGG